MCGVNIRRRFCSGQFQAENSSFPVTESKRRRGLTVIDLDLESFGVSDLERERERGARGLGGEAVTPGTKSVTLSFYLGAIGVVDVAVETTKFQIGECGGGCGGEAVVVSAKHLRHGNPNWLMAMLTDNLELCTGVWRLLIGLLEWSDVVGVLELVSSSGLVEVRSSSPRGRELEVTAVARRSKTQIR
nr:hypothetical protein Iba_chr04aCG19860 [Ipomoea batatas]